MATWSANKVAGKKYTKPTIVGMYILASLNPSTSSGAASANDPTNIFGGHNPDLDKLGKAWASATTQDEYIAKGKVYNKAAYDFLSSIVVFTTGETYAANSKVSEKWNLGKGSFSYQYEYMAGLWYE